MPENNDHERGEQGTKRRRTSEIVQLTERTDPPSSKDASGPLGFLERAQDVLTVRRVYGEPIERNGVTIIPAASVGGGGGGGGGEGPQAQGGRGWGGGFGVGARPAGVYVIRPDGSVRWRPAIDANRMIFMGQLAAIVFFLTVRSVVKALAKRR